MARRNRTEMKIQDIVKRDAMRQLDGQQLASIWLTANGMTQAELAARFGIAQGSLSLVLNGIRTSERVADGIQKVTGIPKSSLRRRPAEGDDAPAS